jgi:hypothetical protein
MLLTGSTALWDCFLRFVLVLWVVRVPLATTALGFFLLGWTSQAQDLFVEFVHSPWWRMLVFVILLVVVWAMPTHYAARMLLDTDTRFQEQSDAEEAANGQKCLACSALQIPRILGLLTFAEVLYAIWRAHANLPDSDQPEIRKYVDRALIEMVLLVLMGAVAYLYWVFRRPTRISLPNWLEWLNKKLGMYLWQYVSPGRLRGSTDEQYRDIGRLVLTVLFIIFLLIFWFGENFAGRFFSRAIAVPFILGGWLPFLSYSSALGRQWRAPLIAGLGGLVAILAVVLGDNHYIRQINAQSAAGRWVDTSELQLQEAVKLWMGENCKSTSTGEPDPNNCPRPIIVAAAGGASRAAFFMASVIGYLFRAAPNHNIDQNDIRKRLFAISSVSGGSVGAVMVTTALNAEDDSKKTPCIRTGVDLWWGNTVNTWQDCFEALTSGDFLTADFFGFAYNDMLPFWLWPDRAAFLEDSWARRYQDIVTDPDPDNTVPNCRGLNCPFLSLRPRKGHWIPLLVLNGTSEATGGRIITTLLSMTYMPHEPPVGGATNEKAANVHVANSIAAKNSDNTAKICPTKVGPPPCPLFIEAERFHYLMTAPVPSDGGLFGWFGAFERFALKGKNGDDITLSTAAHNSARFPLISPPGSIRNDKQMIVDRLVDGGYFENYGALAAKELALAIHAVQPQLMPLVVVISNDPQDLLDSVDDTQSIDSKKSPAEQKSERETKAQKIRAAVNGGELVTDVVAPLTTFANARSAHGILGVDELRTTLHAEIPCDLQVVKVRVWPSNGRSLSMSWWESTPIQRQLHRQTEDCQDLPSEDVRDCIQRRDSTKEGPDHNKNVPHLNAIWAVLKNSTCTAPPESQ